MHWDILAFSKTKAKKKKKKKKKASFWAPAVKGPNILFVIRLFDESPEYHCIVQLNIMKSTVLIPTEDKKKRKKKPKVGNILKKKQTNK